MEAEKMRLPTASDTITEHSQLTLKQDGGSGSGSSSPNVNPYSQSLMRYDSKATLHSQTLSSLPASVVLSIPASLVSAAALDQAYEDRTVGHPPSSKTTASSASSPAYSGSSMPTRLGTSSIPAPLRNTGSHTTSPRNASPTRIIKISRNSQPPPQSLNPVTSLSVVSAMSYMTGASRSATLTPAASGGLRPGPVFGGVQCGGSLAAAIGGGGGSAQYQCSSTPVLVRQPNEIRRLVSPRF